MGHNWDTKLAKMGHTWVTRRAKTHLFRAFSSFTKNNETLMNIEFIRVFSDGPGGT